MKIINLILKSQKKYIMFLILLVLISYGQILNMYVWQDDNALFFKLAHIDEKAGYLGAGPFGVGVYKYTHTPYIPIYKIFGFNTVPYFVYTLTLYIITTIIVYKIFSQILGPTGGKIVGFLYACGYIASDGYIRLFNSVITSVGVILISLLFYLYYKFYKSRITRWYLLSLITYFLAIEFAISRAHYLIGVIFLFEIIFFLRRSLKSLFFSILRIAPFLYLFNLYFIQNGDQRSGQVKNLLTGLASGKFYETYSFIASITSLFIPDWMTGFLIGVQNFLLKETSINLPYGFGLAWLLSVISALFILKGKKIMQVTSFIIISIWAFFENSIYTNPVLNLGSEQHIIIYLGGVLLVFLVIGLFKLKNFRRFYLLISGWMLLNLAAYSSYNPFVYYTSINRYLAHSFLMVTALFAIIYLSIKSPRYKKIALYLIIFWGIGNLLASVFYQHKVIETRSNPPRQFYDALKSFVPTVSKGDIFYLDVADDAKGFYQEAFSVASMPETTALAWRYGVDRYDIKLFTDFSQLSKEIVASKVSPEKIHSFWYSSNGLQDTSKFMQQLLYQNSGVREVAFNPIKDGVIFKDPPSTIVPARLSLTLKAVPVNSNSLTYPFGVPTNAISRAQDQNLASSAFEYKKEKMSIIKNSKYVASSEWQDRVVANLTDFDRETFWQVDRVLWQKRNANLTIELPEILKVNRFVWVNGLENNTPTAYKIEVSLDGKKWDVVKEVKTFERIDTKTYQVVDFDSVNAKFFKMTISDTLSGDSPALSEAWVVPDKFSNLDIKQAEEFLKSPFGYVASVGYFNHIIQVSGGIGQAQVFWKKDKSEVYQTKDSAVVQFPYIGDFTRVDVIIPAGGTKLKEIKLSNFTNLGSVEIIKVFISYSRSAEP